MAKANKSKYALLGVLSHKSGSGYDIKKFCDQSIGYFWNENFGHIYPVLKKLEEENLITKTIEETEGHLQKNIYSITDKGKNELNHWLKLPIDEAPRRSEMLLKIFFSTDIPAKDIIERLEEVKKDCISGLEVLGNVERLLKTNEYTENNSKKDLALWTITVRCGIKNMEAEIEWCDESIEMLKTIDD